MPHPTAIHRLGTALHAAARRYGETLTVRHQTDLSTLEARSLLAKLGLPPDTIPPSGFNRPHIPSPDRESALCRLHAESRRLARLARVRHPAYDLDRHIAVRRLVAVLEPKRPPAPRHPSGQSSEDRCAVAETTERPAQDRPVRRDEHTA